MESAQRTALVAGCARGFTVLCTVQRGAILASLAAIAGPTGLVIAAGLNPLTAPAWSAVRCDPALGLPLRSHIVDAAILQAGAAFAEEAEEVRRVLVPRGDVRVLIDRAMLDRGGAIEAALEAAAIRLIRREPADVLVCRGP